MRVVDADDESAGRARCVNGAEVIPRVDQKTGGSSVQIPGAVSSIDSGGRSKQETAALAGQRLARMRDDRVERRPCDVYTASTAMAIPIPPPIQSDAIPYRRFCARSACTSVVRMRAPLAPIGWPSAIAPP